MSRNETLPEAHNHDIASAQGEYHDVFHHREDHIGLKMHLSYVMLAIIVTGIMGNILSLSVWTRGRLRVGRMAKYMSLLAIADMCTLISGLFIRILPELANINLHQLNPFSCYFQYFFLGFFSCISAWTLITMTVERFVVIAIPLTSSQCLSRCKATAFIALVIVLSALVNSPLILLNTWDADGHCLVDESWEDHVKLAIFTLYSPVPILFLMTLNIAIITKMNRFTNKIDKNPDSMRSHIKVSSRLSSVTSTNSGGIAMTALRQKYNIATHNNSKTNVGNRTCWSNQKAAVTRLVSDEAQAERPSCIPRRLAAKVNSSRQQIASIEGNSGLAMTSIHSTELTSITECSTPDEEVKDILADLPDLVIRNMVAIRENEEYVSDIPRASTDESLERVSAKTATNTDNSNQDNNSNIGLAISSTNLGYYNKSYEGETSIRHVSSVLQNSSPKQLVCPDIIQSLPNNTIPRENPPCLMKRGDNHSPTVSIGCRKALEKRRSSLALMIDNIRVKGEHLAEKYNKIRNKKMAVMLLTVTFSYFLLTTPYTLTLYALVYLTTTSNNLQESHPETLQNIYLVQHVLELLLCLNHSINIILYCATGTKFRQELKVMFNCRAQSGKRSDTQSESHSASQS